MKDDRQILLLSTAAFLCCSVAAGVGLFRPMDEAVRSLASRENSEILDKIGLVASVVGGVEFILVAALALATGLFLTDRRNLAFRLLVAFVVTGVIELGFKMVVPQTPVPGNMIRGTDPSLLDFSTPYPYPSGHMLRSVILLGTVYVLWPNLPVRLCIVAILLASAASRLYLGAHWLSDMVGGALLGIAGLAWAFEGDRSPAIVRQTDSLT